MFSTLHSALSFSSIFQFTFPPPSSPETFNNRQWVGLAFSDSVTFAPPHCLPKPKQWIRLTHTQHTHTQAQCPVHADKHIYTTVAARRRGQSDFGSAESLGFMLTCHISIAFFKWIINSEHSPASFAFFFSLTALNDDLKQIYSDYWETHLEQDLVLQWQNKVWSRLILVWANKARQVTERSRCEQ